MERMAKYFSWLIILLLCSSLNGNQSRATVTVQGQLLRQGRTGTFPAAYVPVSLHRPDGYQISMVYTGKNGIYYIENVPVGQYYLNIWHRGTRQAPLRYRINVYPQYDRAGRPLPYCWIAPITIP